MASAFDRYLQEYVAASGRRYYAVCHWDEQSQTYRRPMSADERRATGCHTYFAKELINLPWKGTFYRDRARAIARARYLYGRAG